MVSYHHSYKHFIKMPRYMHLIKKNNFNDNNNNNNNNNNNKKKKLIIIPGFQSVINKEVQKSCLYSVFVLCSLY